MQGRYFAVRRKIDPTEFISSGDWAPFPKATLYHFVDNQTYELFLHDLPPTVDLVEVVFRLVEERPVVN